ncbi:hypothetical protein PoB_001930100 [Plakobranchus ocellatus]|uniref:Uncharacterized protein n=1 Tax=Plakobranchus ocellatus TaxID=259542 RepID=A0AAV3Z0E7_9GAST|nr:hypothetical protein PoB_001930100 [Plakobranchus ocellatus]
MLKNEGLLSLSCLPFNCGDFDTSMSRCDSTKRHNARPRMARNHSLSCARLPRFGPSRHGPGRARLDSEPGPSFPVRGLCGVKKCAQVSRRGLRQTVVLTGEEMDLK